MCKIKLIQDSSTGMQLFHCSYIYYIYLLTLTFLNKNYMYSYPILLLTLKLGTKSNFLVNLPIKVKYISIILSHGVLQFQKITFIILFPEHKP
jgi:hypothetical protein